MGTLAVLLNDKSNFVSETDEDTAGKNDNQEDSDDVCQSFASRLSSSMESAVHRTTCARPSDYLLPIGTNAPGRLKTTRSNQRSVNGIVAPPNTSPMVMPSNRGLALKMQLLISPQRTKKEGMREVVDSQRNLAAVSSACNPSEEFLCDPKSRAYQISAVRLARIHVLRDEFRRTNEHGIDSFGACSEAQQEQSRFSIHRRASSYQNLSLWSDDEDDNQGSGNHLLETWNRSITARSKRNSINSV